MMAEVAEEKQKPGKKTFHYCAAIGCHKYREGGEGLLFATFPSGEKDLERCKKWIRNTRRDLVCPHVEYVKMAKEKQEKWTSAKSLLLCEDHFQADQFNCPADKGIQKSGKRLLKTSIPTLFDLPQHLQRVQSTRKPPLKRSQPTSSDDVPAKKPRTTGAGGDDGDRLRVPASTSRPVTTQQPDLPQPQPNSSTTQSDFQLRIKFLSDENKRMYEMIKQERRKNQGLTARLAEKEKFAPSSNRKENLITCMAQYLSKPGLEIFKSQLLNHEREPRGRRFTDELKVICYGLQKGSPKIYKSLSNIFILPGVKTLELLQQNVVVETGICQAVVDTLRQQVEGMKELEKETVLCLDEMTLKSFLSFRANIGLMEGFVDYGPLGRRAEYGNEALAFHLHGMYTRWKQPIGYIISNSATPADIMHAMIQRVLQTAQEIGLRVRVMISDQGTNNQALVNRYLKVTPEKPYFHSNGQKIYLMYDPPHLLKSVRNNLVGKDFLIDDKLVASWDHFTKLVEIETESPTAFRLAPKLTASRHGNPTAFKKMKVKTAAQTFSNTVAAAMTTYAVTPDSSMPVDAASSTANTFKKLDSIFDTFNSSHYFSQKPFKCALKKDSPHHDFLLEMREFFSKLKMREKRAWMKSVGRVSRPPCFNGWVLSINALLQLWEDVEGQNGVYYLCTRRLNQDCLENLFGVIRRSGGNRDNPSAGQFRESFRYAMVSDVLDLHHSEASNCEADLAKTLFRLSGGKRRDATDPDADNDSDNDSDGEDDDKPDENLPDFLKTVETVDTKTAEENMIYYFAGRCASRFKKFHKNSTCTCVEKVSIDRNAAKFSDKQQFYMYMKTYKQSEGGDGFGGLTVPSAEFVNFIRAQINEVFKKKFEKNVLCSHVDDIIFSGMDVSFGLPTECQHALIRTVRYFIRTRIYYICKNLNAKLASLPSTKQNRKMVKVSHQ